MSDQPEQLCHCPAMIGRTPLGPHRHAVATLSTRETDRPAVRITPKRGIVKQRCAHCTTWATLIVRVLDTTTGEYGPIREMCERHAENARRVNELENRS